MKFMGIAVRRVPSDWVHPKDENGRHVPLRNGLDFERRTREWDEGAAKWQQGLRKDLDTGDWVLIEAHLRGMAYTECAGSRPDPHEFTPPWPAHQCTHWQMYEEVTEGTPISPACVSPEELARWMADHEPNAGVSTLVNYLDWLALIRQTPSIYMQPQRDIAPKK